MTPERSGSGSGRRAISLAAAFAVLWVVLEQVVGTRLQGSYPLLQVVWSRYAVHLFVLVVVWGWREPHRLWRTGRPGFQIARSLLMLVMPWSFVAALASGTSAEMTWAVFWVAPVIAVAGAYALGEKATLFQWLLTGTGAVVSAVMLARGSFGGFTSLLYPGLMAASFGFYVVMTRSLRTEPVLTNLFYTAAGVFVATTPLVVPTWVTPTVADAGVLAAIGVVGLAALWTLDRSTVHAPVAGVAPVFYVHVVAAAALAVLRGYHPGTVVMLGSLVLIGIGAWQWASFSPGRARAEAT